MLSNLPKRAVAFVEDLEKQHKRFEKIPQEIKLFLSGAKPTLALTTSNTYAKLLMEHYPSFTRPIPAVTGLYVFNDYSKMHDYMSKLELYHSSRLEEPILVHTLENLGLALGYPPSACEWFEKSGGISSVPDEDKKNVCVVYYHGMQFCTMQHLLEENIQWLYNNIVVRDEIKTKEYVEYPYFEGSGRGVTIRARKSFEDAVKRIKEEL